MTQGLSLDHLKMRYLLETQMWQAFLIVCVVAGVAIAREHYPNPAVPIIIFIIMVMGFFVSVFGGDKIFALMCAVSTLIFITVLLTYAGMRFNERSIKNNSNNASNQFSLPSFQNINTPSSIPISTFSTPTPFIPQTNINPVNPVSFQFNFPTHFIAELYHGTPSVDNARDIISGGGTFIVGSGNQYGTGVYFADFNTAKDYAHSSGAILKVAIMVPPNQVADYNELPNTVTFPKLGSSNGDKITNYVLKVLKKRYLKVNDNLVVALADRTNVNERVVFEGVGVTDIYDYNGNHIIP